MLCARTATARGRTDRQSSWAARIRTWTNGARTRRATVTPRPRGPHGTERLLPERPPDPGTDLDLGALQRHAWQPGRDARLERAEDAQERVPAARPVAHLEQLAHPVADLAVQEEPRGVRVAVAA